MVDVSSWYHFIFTGYQNSNACTNWYYEMASIFVYLLLPMAGLITIWLRTRFFTRILILVDGFYLPMPYPVLGRGKTMLDWARSRLPQQWSSHLGTLSGGLADFWNDGSLLCTVINTAIPGACANPYRHWRKSPNHAQEVAYKYLGIVPVFTESDFSSVLSPYLEAKLLNYLLLIRKSIRSLEKEKLIYNQISSEFLARGMGLYTAEQFKPSEFFIYSKCENVSFFNLEIIILGPYSSHCRTTVLQYFVRKSKAKNVHEFVESSPESINIQLELDKDRVKISYVTRNCGIHEISLTCNKENIMGSPFYVNVMKYAEIKSTYGNRKDSGVQTENLKLISDKLDEKPNKMSEGNINDYKANNNSTGIQRELDGMNREAMMKIKSSIGDNQTNKLEIISKKIDEKSNKICEKNIDDCKAENNSIKIHHDVNKEAISKNKSSIDNSQTLKISKYLKDLNNCREKEVNIFKNLLTNKDETCPNFYTKDNYSYFQKLVNISFRKTCRVTRASPRFCQKMFPQFSCASPVCRDHIVPEGFRKLSADEKRKMFSLRKPTPINSSETITSSSFSINENQEETEKISKGNINAGEVHQNSKEPNKSINEKSVTRLNSEARKRNLQKIVLEKKLFWETVFNDAPVGSSSEETGSDQAIERSLKRSSGQLSHVDSLYLQRQKPVSKSLNDIRNTDKRNRMQLYRSLDDNLNLCCKIRLEDRAKLYLDNARFISGELEQEWAVISQKHGITRKLSSEFTKPKFEKKLTNHKVSSDAASKRPFKKAYTYFRNLEIVKLKPGSNRIAPLESGHLKFESEDMSLNNNTHSMFSAQYRSCYTKITERNYCTYTIPRNTRRKSVVNFFDVLY